MGYKHQREKAPRPMAGSIGLGVLISVLLSILLAAGIAMLMLSEHLKEENIQLYSFIVIFISVFTGGLSACGLAKEKYAMMSGITALVYLLLLVCASVFVFEGGLNNIWTSALVIALGYVLSCVVCIVSTGRKPHRKRTTR